MASLLCAHCQCDLTGKEDAEKIYDDWYCKDCLNSFEQTSKGEYIIPVSYSNVDWMNDDGDEPVEAPEPEVEKEETLNLDVDEMVEVNDDDDDDLDLDIDDGEPLTIMLDEESPISVEARKKAEEQQPVPVDLDDWDVGEPDVEEIKAEEEPVEESGPTGILKTSADSTVLLTSPAYDELGDEDSDLSMDSLELDMDADDELESLPEFEAVGEDKKSGISGKTEIVDLDHETEIGELEDGFQPTIEQSSGEISEDGPEDIDIDGLDDDDGLGSDLEPMQTEVVDLDEDSSVDDFEMEEPESKEERLISQAETEPTEIVDLELDESEESKTFDFDDGNDLKPGLASTEPMLDDPTPIASNQNVSTALASTLFEEHGIECNGNGVALLKDSDLGSSYRMPVLRLHDVQVVGQAEAPVLRMKEADLASSHRILKHISAQMRFEHQIEFDEAGVLLLKESDLSEAGFAEEDESAVKTKKSRKTSARKGGRIETKKGVSDEMIIKICKYIIIGVIVLLPFTFYFKASWTTVTDAEYEQKTAKAGFFDRWFDLPFSYRTKDSWFTWYGRQILKPHAYSAKEKEYGFFTPLLYKEGNNEIGDNL